MDTSNVIDCRFLFDAIRSKNKDSAFWLAGMILGLDVGIETKYKLGELLIKNQKALNWLFYKLEEEEGGID